MKASEMIAEITPETLATSVLETTPLIMYFLRRRFNKLNHSPLSLPQLRVLAFLDNCPGSSLSNLAESLGVTNASTSTIIDRLVQIGSVKRVDDPKERRKLILSLTNNGKQHLTNSRKLSVGDLTALLSTLSSNELRTINNSVRVLRKIFFHAQKSQNNGE